MASDELRSAVMQAFPLRIGPTNKPPQKEETVNESKPEIQEVQDKEGKPVLADNLLKNKSGMDLLKETLERHIEIEKTPEDPRLDEERARVNSNIDRNLIRDLI